MIETHDSGLQFTYLKKVIKKGHVFFYDCTLTERFAKYEKGMFLKGIRYFANTVMFYTEEKPNPEYILYNELTYENSKLLGIFSYEDYDGDICEVYFDNCELIRDFGPYKMGDKFETIILDLEDMKIKFFKNACEPNFHPPDAEIDIKIETEVKQCVMKT